MINNINPKIMEILSRETRLIKNNKQLCIDMENRNKNEENKNEENKKNKKDRFLDVFLEIHNMTKKRTK